MVDNLQISQKRIEKSGIKASKEHKKIVGSKEKFLKLLKKAVNRPAFDKKP